MIDTKTNSVEHPELVAQRLERFAKIVGKERVIAGTELRLRDLRWLAAVPSRHRLVEASSADDAFVEIGTLSALRGLAYVVERAADPLHRARIDTKSLGYLAHALGTPWRLPSGTDLGSRSGAIRSI